MCGEARKLDFSGVRYRWLVGGKRILGGDLATVNRLPANQTLRVLLLLIAGSRKYDIAWLSLWNLHRSRVINYRRWCPPSSPYDRYGEEKQPVHFLSRMLHWEKIPIKITCISFIFLFFLHRRIVKNMVLCMKFYNSLCNFSPNILHHIFDCSKI